MSSIPDAIPRTRSSSFDRIDKPPLDSDSEEMVVESVKKTADALIVAAVGVGVIKVDKDIFVVILSALFVLADVVLVGVGVVLESNISCPSTDPRVCAVTCHSEYICSRSTLISFTSFLSPLVDRFVEN
jgi:hypothetical protein